MTSVKDHFNIAASKAAPDPDDPIANSFTQYKTLAELRCSIQISQRKSSLNFDPFYSDAKGSVETLDLQARNPELVLTKWVDRAGVVRTRNKLSEGVPEVDEHISRVHRRQLWREMKRAAQVLVNKDHIKEYTLLDCATVEALRHYTAGNYRNFLSDVLNHKIVTSDLLSKVGRGPVFEPWMLKEIIFEAVIRSAVDFNKKAADNAVAATAHFIGNNGTVKSRHFEIGYHEWKTDSDASLQNYFAQAEDMASNCSVFNLFEQIVLQFGTPANIGASSVEDLICQSALTYAIILQASSRAVEQLVRDSSEHAAKVAMDMGMIFAAISLGAGAAPIPYISSVVSSSERMIELVVSNYATRQVGGVTAIATTLNDQFANFVLKPALAGDRVPGLLEQVDHVSFGTPTTPKRHEFKKKGIARGEMGIIDDKAGENISATARRRQLGRLFRDKYTEYIGMMDTIHTPMRKL